MCVCVCVWFCKYVLQQHCKYPERHKGKWLKLVFLYEWWNGPTELTIELGRLPKYIYIYTI